MSRDDDTVFGFILVALVVCVTLGIIGLAAYRDGVWWAEHSKKYHCRAMREFTETLWEWDPLTELVLPKDYGRTEYECDCPEKMHTR